MKKEIKPYKNKKLNGANFNDFTHNEYRVYLNLIGKIVKVDDKGNHLPPNKLKRDYVLSAKEFNNIFNCKIMITRKYAIYMCIISKYCIS